VSVVLRMCLGCRARRPVAELTRLCLCDGELRIDVPGGRGAWVCRGEAACLERALAGKRLERALRAAVPSEELDRVRGLLLGDLGRDGTL
jgi:predicted RNA-binding protein YlxR (DUF448 family)